MATSSSSTKKAAKLAQKGKGQKVRFQGGTLFPFVVALVIVLGFGLVVYARQSRPPADASAPQVTDHWHHAYGFYLCDTWFELSGNAEEQDSTGQLINNEFRRTGIHSHDDGVIHWHPFTSAAVGRNADLGVFLDVYDVGLSSTKLTFPSEQRPLLPYQQETGVFEEDETKCTVDGEERSGSLKVVVWDNFSDTDEGTTFVADFNNIRLDQNGMAIAIAFVPNNTDVGLPPSAPGLLEAAAADTNQLRPEDLLGGTTTIPDPATVPAGTTGDPATTGDPVTTGEPVTTG